MMRRKELLPRHRWTGFSSGQIELNPARNQYLCHQCQLQTLQFYYFPSSFPSPVSNSSCSSLDASLCVCTTVLFKVLYCEIRNVFFIFCVFLPVVCMKSIIKIYYVCKHAQLCLILCSPIDCSPPSSSVHRISQAKILEWVTISFSNKAFLSSLKRVIFTLCFISSIFGLLHHGARAG